MNIPHSRFILFKLKIFGEIVTTLSQTHIKILQKFYINRRYILFFVVDVLM